VVKGYEAPTALPIEEWLERHHAVLRGERRETAQERTGAGESRNKAPLGHRARVAPIRNTCARCERVFEARRVDARFCSDACRVAAQRARAA
jgi:hypothetical protein